MKTITVKCHTLAPERNWFALLERSLWAMTVTS